MSASSKTAPSRQPAGRRAQNLARRRKLSLPFPCPECGLTYATPAARTTHRRREHGIYPESVARKPRTGKKSEHSGTIGKVASQQRRGFAEVRNRIVRGNNADSAEAWLVFGAAMFGGSR